MQKLSKTLMLRKEDVNPKWYLVNAEGKVLGRLATRIVKILMGKHKSTYTPHVVCGDFVVVTNAEKIKLTGNKLSQKKYYRHSGYPGGLKVKTAGELLKSKPQEIIFHAVSGMLPKNRLRDKMLKRLKVYSGPEHPHKAQNPEPIEV